MAGETRVMSYEEARAKRPHLFEGRDGEWRDFEFRVVSSAQDNRSTAIEALPRSIEGYVCRWGIPVHSTRLDSATGRRYVERIAYARDSLDAWLASHRPSDAFVQRNHEGPVLGRWVSLAADAVGLRGRAELAADATAHDALTEIRTGRIAGLSSAMLFTNADTTIEHDADGPYRLVHRMSMSEAGPVDEPADDECRIEWLGNQWLGHDLEPRDFSHAPRPDECDGNLDSFMRHLESLTGVRAQDVLDKAEFARYRRAEAADEWTRRTDRIASALKAAREKALSDYGWWRRGTFADERDGAEYRMSKAAAERVEADLLAHLDGDRTAVALVCAERGLPALPSDLDRIRDLRHWL